MRKICYKKRQSLKNRRKRISIHEVSEDKDCKTDVQKSFIYIVSRVSQVTGKTQNPEIFIRKAFDSRTRQEKFRFKVKGSFFLTRDRNLFKVDFCHTLYIAIIWKNKIFSPKKSVTLT
jgi:hypothetical protein